jgi:cytidine deaminase
MSDKTQNWDEEVLKAYENAKLARTRAYAKYSNFKVGACLVLNNGEQILGCNVENVSNGATRCAEQGAICQTQARFGEIDAKFLMVVSQSTPPVGPCGICLQVLTEFVSPDFPIYIAGLDKIYAKHTLKDFLPMAFTSDQMLSATTKTT